MCGLQETAVVNGSNRIDRLIFRGSTGDADCERCDAVY